MSTDYNKEAISDAVSTAREFLDQIVEKVCDGEDISDDLLNDYGTGDAYHHESHVDKEYGLADASDLLSQLSDHEETDTGLWEGQEPRKAIATQAAFTYGNAVMHHWQELIEELNDDNVIEAFRDTIANEFEGKENCDRIRALVTSRIETLLDEYGE